MLLLVWANWYDCADGQLARMTNQRTLIGRLLDGLAGEIWFLSIYLGLAMRLDDGPLGLWTWPLLCYTGFYCHAHQASLADYYRNIHLWFLFSGKGNGSELDRSELKRARYEALHWNGKEWFEKLYLFFYCAYTMAQEHATPAFQRFYKKLKATYGDNIPDDLRQRFRQKSRPLMKYCNILTFDTRVGVLFLSLLVGQPIIFPLFEITVLEILRAYTRRRHERFCQAFYEELNQETKNG